MEIVRCPKCRKRLFDRSDGMTGVIVIPCRRCKTILAFDFSSPASPQSTQATEPSLPKPAELTDRT